MNLSKATVGTVALAAAGVSAYIGLRFFIRYKVYQTLVAPESEGGYDYENMLNQNILVKSSAKALDLPTARELSVSVVPIMSFVGPFTAIEDILAKGRKSKYWPPNRRKSKAPKAVDQMAFGIMRQMYYAPPAPTK